MNQLLFICIISFLFYGSTSALNITLSNNVTYYFDSPNDPIPGYDGIFNLTDKLLYIPPDTFGCDYAKLIASGEVKGRIVLAASDDCSSSIRITNAFNAGAAGIIMIWQKTGAPAGVQFTWAAQDIKPSQHIFLPTVELSLTDGTNVTNMFKNDPNAMVSMVNGDPNIWVHYFHGGGMIFWQVSLSILLIIPLCIAYYKFFILITTWREQLIWGFLNTQAYVLYTVMIACSLSLCYVAVDPLHSRGIYNNVGDVVLTTLGIDPTLVGTFLITMIWITSFKTDSVFSRKEVVAKISKIFLGIILFAFAVDLISSFIKGYYINTSDTQYIIGVYYIIAAFGITVFYIYVAVSIKKKIKNIEELFPEDGAPKSSTLSAIEKVVNRSMWRFSVLWGIWILTAGVSISSIVLEPLPRLINFWIIYAIIALVNLCHVFMIKLTATAGEKSGGSTEVDMQSSTFKSESEVV